MAAEIHVFRCLDDNIGALVHDTGTGACAAIDVPEAGAVLGALEEKGWLLTDILVTHRHGDHIQGIPVVKARTGCRVIAPAKARAEVPDADEWVGEGDTVQVGQLSAAVWETPGHCRDHVSFVFGDAGLVFAGDTLFTLGCGRVMESPYSEMWRSLERLAALPAATQVYSGHDYVLSNAKFALAADPDNADLKRRAEEAQTAIQKGRFLVPSTIGEELATNPFLRAGEAALARSVDRAGQSPEAVFTALREWKNSFR